MKTPLAAVDVLCHGRYHTPNSYNKLARAWLTGGKKAGDLPPLLEVRDLHTEFRTGAGIVPAVDGISYTVEGGETVAIVGESGSGKTAGALSILRLIPDPPGRITKGADARRW